MRSAILSGGISLRRVLAAGIWCVGMIAGMGAEEPKFPRVSDLVREVEQRLQGVGEDELSRAAVVGLVEQLKPRLQLSTNGVGQAEGEGKQVPRASVYADHFGYVRIAEVENGLKEGLEKAVGELPVKEKLKGLILDLRFARGWRYSAGAEAAGLFVVRAVETGWGYGSARIGEDSAKFRVPLVVLINEKTAGAPEMLAAALREGASAVLLGETTAGYAFAYEALELNGSWVLHIASGTVELAGQTLSGAGVTPDIRVKVPLDEARSYYENPMKPVPKTIAGLTLGDGSEEQRRLNEADLVRMQEENLDSQTVLRLEEEQAVQQTVVYDPVLARALDLLKGVALMRRDG